MYIYIYIYAYVISRSGSGKGDPTYSRRVPEGPGGGFSDLSVDPRRKRKREERKTSLVICTSSFSSWEIFGKSKVRVKGKGGGWVDCKRGTGTGGKQTPMETQTHSVPSLLKKPRSHHGIPKKFHFWNPPPFFSPFHLTPSHNKRAITTEHSGKGVSQTQPFTNRNNGVTSLHHQKHQSPSWEKKKATKCLDFDPHPRPNKNENEIRHHHHQHHQ